MTILVGIEWGRRISTNIEIETLVLIMTDAGDKQYFLIYRLENSNKQGVVVTGGSFFSRGSRFRYAGKCEKEVVEESSGILREPPTVNRVSLKNIGRSTSLPTTPADSDTYDGSRPFFIFSYPQKLHSIFLRLNPFQRPSFTTYVYKSLPD